ncbi:hypothetical protein EBZ37_02205 [bacterium]|nr:hypothetical protein [bacterium]
MAQASQALADPVAATLDSTATPCGIIEKSAGEAFILDSTRSHVDEARDGKAIPCDSWVSTAEGWVEIRNQNGHLFRLSKTTFVQLQNQESVFNLFRGVVYIQAFGDSKPLVATSPNSRAKIKMGSGLVIYSPEAQSTQLVVLDQVASIENRFEAGTEVTVREGESSILDLTRPRVSPRDPRAITVASLKPFLKDLALSDKKMSRAVRVALERQRRVFPGDIATEGHVAATESRAPASAEHGIQEIYRRHPTDKHSASLEKAFRKKVLRGTVKVSHKAKKFAEMEELEMRLTRKAQKEQVDRRAKLLKELGRLPASQ